MRVGPVQGASHNTGQGTGMLASHLPLIIVHLAVPPPLPFQDSLVVLSRTGDDQLLLGLCQLLQQLLTEGETVRGGVREQGRVCGHSLP